MALLKIQFDSPKGVIIPVFIATAEDTVKIENEKDKEKYIKTLPKFNCLIDTGAFRSFVSQRLAEKLKLNSSKVIPVLTASGKVRVKTYFVTFIIPMGDCFRFFENIEVAEYQSVTNRHDVLLGRDILMRGIFQTDWSGQAILGF